MSGRVGLSVIPAPPSCRPNQAILSDTCTRLSLYVDAAKLRPSITTEDLCNEIRRLVAVHQASKSIQFEVVVLCDLKLGFNDTVEITIVSADAIRLFLVFRSKELNRVNSFCSLVATRWKVLTR